MAHTEIYIIRKDRTIDSNCINIPHAMSGALLIWRKLEEKYLPSLPLMEWQKPGEYNSRIFRKEASEIWALSYAKETEWNDRILLELYMDKSYVAYKHLHEAAEALRSSEFASDNMKAQADALDLIYNEKKNGDVLGIMINATSVTCAEDFMDCEYDENMDIIQRRLPKDNYEVFDYLNAMKASGWNWKKYMKSLEKQS